MRGLLAAALAAAVWVGVIAPGPALEDAARTGTVDGRPATAAP